jgi:hypothetical protein
MYRRMIRASPESDGRRHRRQHRQDRWPDGSANARDGQFTHTLNTRPVAYGRKIMPNSVAGVTAGIRARRESGAASDRAPQTLRLSRRSSSSRDHG